MCRADDVPGAPRGFTCVDTFLREVSHVRKQRHRAGTHHSKSGPKALNPEACCLGQGPAPVKAGPPPKPQECPIEAALPNQGTGTSII